MSNNKKLYETFLRHKVKSSRCVLEQVVSWADRLDEATVGSLYKGSVFFGPDDIKFLQQFPRRHWVQALKQRYNSDEPNFNSLFNYLVNLQKERDKVVKEKFPEYYQREMKHFMENPYYQQMDKNLLRNLAVDHARVGANRDAYLIVPTDKYPAPDGPQDFVFKSGRTKETYRANPHINDLVKKLEGTFDNEDGFDLFNPTKTVKTEIDDETGKAKTVTLMHTDGFRFPSERSFNTFIQDYLKYVGHGIIKIDDEDLQDTKLLADKQENRNPNGSMDTLTKELALKDLQKRYGYTKQQALEHFKELVRNGDIKGLNGSSLDDNGIGELLIPHKEVTITKVIDGRPTTETVLNPILGSGHFIRRLEKHEADAVERVLNRGEDGIVNPEDLEIFERLKNKIRGNHYDPATETLDANNKPVAGSGRHRPIYVNSHDDGGMHRQGSDHMLAGGFSPNQETDGRKFLTKYGVYTKKYQDKINKLFRIYVTDKLGVIQTDEAGNPIPNPQADLDGSKLKADILKVINNRLALGTEVRKTSAVHRDTSPERLILRSAKNQIAQLVFKRIMERLGTPNIENHDAIGRKIRNSIIEDELNDLVQQNIAGRGTRRTRDKGGVGEVYPIGEIKDIRDYAEYVACSKDHRKLGQRCAFNYDLDKLIDRSKYLTDEIVGIVNNINKDYEMSAKNVHDEIQDMKDAFSEALSHLQESFFVLMMAQSQANTDKSIDQSTIDKIKQKVYGSGDGSDGDFSGFPPDVKKSAKDYFMRYFSRKSVDDAHFSKYVQMFRHEDVQLSDELQIMYQAKEAAQAFLQDLTKTVLPTDPSKDEPDFNKILIGHISNKIKSNIDETSKLLNMPVPSVEPQAPEAQQAEPVAAEQPVETPAEAPVVGLTVMSQLKDKLDANPLNYDMIARQTVEELGKKYPEETPAQIQNLVNQTKEKIQNAIMKSQKIIRNNSYFEINQDLVNLLPKENLSSLYTNLQNYQNVKKFGILEAPIKMIKAELERR